MSKQDAQDKIKKLFDQKIQGTGGQRATVCFNYCLLFINLFKVSSAARSRSTMARESRAMSALASSRMTSKKDNMDENQRAEAKALEEVSNYLLNLSVNCFHL